MSFLKKDATPEIVAAVQSIEDRADECYKPLTILQLPANGIRRGDSSNEQDQRKDQIIKMKSIPVGVGKLQRKCIPKARFSIHSLCHAMKNFFCAHYPEHIKPAKGI